ncbi:MAG: PASTA domain-containing protein [Candidatus Hydrogenedentes bacterium]|nr:PASTA domain-containing protein [Candidatus Hydrogenedentota bacterium]
MKKLLRVMCVALGLAVAAVSAAALENGKQCAKATEKAEKGKAAVPGRTPISKDPWTPAGAQDKVVYGTDDRIDVYQETDPLRRELAGSVCGLVATSDLTPLSGGRWELSLYYYTSGGYPACPGEPFGSQPVAAWCTGFLVGDDLIATAGHCFSDGEQADVRFIFGFEMADATTPVYELEASQVYTAVEVVGWALSGGLDYCIVRVDRPVTAPGAQPLPIRRSDTVPLDTPVGVIGHPAGLPKKIAFGPTTEVADNAAPGYFVANLDTYGGNSGSPVFNAATGVVEGILVRGETDFNYDSDSACFYSNVLADSAAGEEVSKSATFAQFIPEYVPEAGKITLDKEAYKPTDIVQIMLEDVLAAPSAAVEIVGEFHTKTLALNAVVKAAVTQFTGAVQLYTSGKATPTEGLYVVDGGEMTVRYYDADDGSGSPAVVEKTVPIDGTAPVISNASATAVGGTTAVIIVEADEPVTATVRYGTDCASLTQTAQTTGGPALNPGVPVVGLVPDTPYFFAVDVVDAAGNTASSDNGGACFTFTTTGFNDTCADAWPLLIGAPVSGSNAGAAADYDAGDGSGADVWFTFTAPATATYAFFTCGSALDTVLHAFSGDCGALVPLTSNDDWCDYQSKVRVPMTEGSACYIRVAGYNGETGDYTLTAEESTPLPNDLCGNAVALEAGVAYEGDSTAAGTEYDNDDWYDMNDVWFTFTPAETGTYTVSLCGSAIDSTLFVFSGSCDAPVQVAYNDDYCDYQSWVSAPLNAAETYLIRVADYDELGGAYTIVVDYVEPMTNDLCADAISLEEGVAFNGDSTGAGTDYDTEDWDGADVWFSFTPGTMGLYDISLCGSSFDTTLTVFLGGCADPVEIGYNDDYCDYQSQVRETLQAGETCLIRVADYDELGGAYTVLVTYAGEPADPCPDDPVADSGFESGSPSLGWEEYSLNYGTPLCDASCNASFAAYEGDWFVWFGGTNTAESGWVAQNAAIPAAASATLSFYVRIPTAGTTGHMAFLMDDDELFRMTEADAVQYAEWTLVQLDVSAYADGETHELVFESAVEAPDTDVLNLFVDQVCIETAGSGTVTVPTVVGQAQADAEAALTGAGLAVGTVTQQCSNTVAAGGVLSQNPGGGTQAAAGSEVALVVSSGPCNNTVAVPGVVGQARADAEAALTGAGLTVGGVTEVYSDTAPAGTVVGQNPPAGAQAAPGAAVSLTVSKGVDPAAGEAARTALRDAFNQADTDGSGGLTFDEAQAAVPGLTQAVFTFLDANGDGVLDTAELGIEDSGCGCGCSKSDLTPDGVKKRLGDLFLGGLALVLLAVLGRRAGV